MELSCGPYEQQLKDAHKARVARMNGTTQNKPVQIPISENTEELRAEIERLKARCEALEASIPQKREADDEAPQLTIAKIKRVVAEAHGLNIAVLDSARKDNKVVFPRQIAMYLCRQHTRFSHPVIGFKFGGRDHTTCMHAARKIENIRKIDPEFDAELRELEAKLGCV